MKRFMIIFVLAIAYTSCKKEPGIGGDASVTGRVWVRDYNSTFTQLIGEYPAEDNYVYLVFGDNVGYDKRVKTDYDGYFRFDYLYKGDYEVYVYSTDSTLTDINNFVPVIIPVTIDERKANIDVGTITIFD